MIEFPFVGGRLSVSPEDIIYIETRRHRNIFFMAGGGEHSIYMKLDEIEALLRDYDFLRVHRSYLVNLKYVFSVKNYLMTLKNGKLLTVPRARYRDVKELVTDYRENKQSENNKTED